MPKTTVKLAKTAKPIFFISDIHLHHQKPELTQLFLSFLQEKAIAAQALFILGDLFDVWLGDDLASDFENKIAQAISALSHANIPTYFMPGNRDFLLRNKYCRKANMILLADPCLLHYHNQKLLLTHGDRLCTDDVNYQKYRKFAQNPITRSLFLLLPKKVRNNIAQKLRQKSRDYQQQQPSAKLDVTELGVQSFIHNHPASGLIHGHVHREKTVQHQLKSGPITRYVLGTWHHCGSYIKLDGNHVGIFRF